eukprot:scaffold132125_cov42-Prasinocladus_malaysianus.AAC.1
MAGSRDVGSVVADMLGNAAPEALAAAFLCGLGAISLARYVLLSLSPNLNTGKRSAAAPTLVAARSRLQERRLGL